MVLPLFIYDALERFRYFKRGPEICSFAGTKTLPVYVGFPTDSQNWHVILLQRQKLMRPRAAKKRCDFDPHAFLATIGEGRKFVLYPKKQGVFAQGDTADAVFYVQTGKVKLTVVSTNGKEQRSAY